ncbi:MAG: molybdopterin-guanine dinucleotide biosynthesis protein B, partial [Proteobacteria bacterium]|nr:molybdopterin-guanine dinucleotide biosynthesis protein B [Pseudomonadota bacterium]
MRLPPMVSFVGPSGTGKTTLIERVIVELTHRGFRIGVLKHDAHRLELDKPGKDTWRFRQAGAWRAVIVGDEQMAIFSAVDGELSLGGVAAETLLDADLVITEGFRQARLPTIRVFRAARPVGDWQALTEPIAWVSDVPHQVDVPVIPLDQPSLVADFLAERFLGAAGHHRRA